MDKELGQNKRADELQVGEVIVIPWGIGERADSTCRVVVVTELELIGDDVEVNGWLSTSRGNLFTTVPKFRQ